VSWFDPLFPGAERSAAPAWLIATLYPLAAIGLAALALLRQSGVPATNTLWAEDGAIFIQQNRTNGFLHTLTTPYAGYLELAPRLFVQLTRLVPLADSSAVMAITGACLLSLVCCYIFHASRGVLPPVWCRTVLVSVVILLPLATGEILDNLVNIGWWLFFAAFWALITRPRTTADAVLAGAVTFLAIGTEPLVALLFPVVVARVFVARTNLRQEASLIGFVLGLAYQAIGIVKAHGTGSTVNLHGVIASAGVRVGWEWLTGDDLTGHILSSSHAYLWQVGGYLILAGVVAVAILLRHRTTLFFVIAAVGLAIITYAIPVAVRGAGPGLIIPPVYVGSRYSATPVLLVWSAVLAEVYQASKIIHPRWARYAPVAACLVLLVPVWALDFRTANLRTDGPRWDAQVSAATRLCDMHPKSKVALQISPPGWKVLLPCDDGV
jgi:hypothetical protein